MQKPWKGDSFSACFLIERPRQAFLLLSLMDTISQLKYPPLREQQLSPSRPKTSLSFYASMECKTSITFIILLNRVSILVQWDLTQLTQAAINLRSSPHQLAASSLRQHTEGSLKWATEGVLMSEGHDIGSSGPHRRYFSLLQVLGQEPSSLSAGAGTEGNRESRGLPGTRGPRSVLVQA